MRTIRLPTLAGGIALLVVVLLSLAELRAMRVPVPFEDAAMLFRYAGNLANGGGIAWNFGEFPGLTDGATDLGFVLALWPLIVLGMSASSAALLLNLASVFCIGFLVGLVIQRIWQAPLWIALLMATLIAAGPVNRYLLSGFSAPISGLLLAAIATVVILADQLPPTRYRIAMVIAGALAGVSGWWRPEGFFFGVLVLFAAVLMSRRKKLSELVADLSFALIPYFTLVALWIIFRLAYFGQLLPTSALMKSGRFTVSNGLFSLQFYVTLIFVIVALAIYGFGFLGKKPKLWLALAIPVLSLCWIGAAIPTSWWARLHVEFVPTLSNIASLAILVPMLIGFCFSKAWRDRVPIIVFTLSLGLTCAAWIAIETTMNWWGRMQWQMVPTLFILGLFALSGKQTGWWQKETRLLHKPPSSVLIAGIAGLLILLPFHLPKGGYEEAPFQSSLASAIEELETETVRIATTEAGLIPLAWKGPALDTFGLNDREIAASKGTALRARLEEFKPDILVVHGPTPPSLSETCSADLNSATASLFDPVWVTMTARLYEYAQVRQMTVVQSLESAPCDSWTIFAGTNAPQALVDELRSVKLRSQ